MMQSYSVNVLFWCGWVIKQANRNRPVNLIIKSPVDCDSAAFFFTNIEAELQAKIPYFYIAHDRSDAELPMKKKYDALKQQLKEKIYADEVGWRIKTCRSESELVQEQRPFRPQAEFEMW